MVIGACDCCAEQMPWLQLEIKRRTDEIEKKTKEVDLLNRKLERLNAASQGEENLGGRLAASCLTATALCDVQPSAWH